MCRSRQEPLLSSNGSCPLLDLVIGRDFLCFVDDHQVYFQLFLVDELDQSSILSLVQVKDPCGEKGFYPGFRRSPRAAFVEAAAFSYSIYTISSRRIERAWYEVLAFWVLIGIQQPDHCQATSALGIISVLWLSNHHNRLVGQRCGQIFGKFP